MPVGSTLTEYGAFPAANGNPVTAVNAPPLGLIVYPRDSRVPPYFTLERLQAWLPELKSSLAVGPAGGARARMLSQSELMGTALDQYGVIGHPVGHSLSPFIHGMFARDCGQNISYRLYDVAPGESTRACARSSRRAAVA